MNSIPSKLKGCDNTMLKLTIFIIYASSFCLAQVSLVQPKFPALTENLVPCTCGIFLSGQFVKGSRQQPTGYPVLLHEYDTPFSCTSLGHRQCANKCLDVIARHLPNSANIVCGTSDRDCYKERAYLWTKNCKDLWENSNMSAGREFCCKEGKPYSCALGKQ